MKVLLSGLIVIQLVLLSCKGDDSAKQNEHAANILSQLNLSDTFLFDFPLYYNNQLDGVVLVNLRRQEKWLNLPSLRKGFDSIEIRIWYGCYYIGCNRRLVRL